MSLRIPTSHMPLFALGFVPHPNLRSERSRTLYILDEPATGLHPVDIPHLLPVLSMGLIFYGELPAIAGSDWQDGREYLFGPAAPLTGQ